MTYRRGKGRFSYVLPRRLVYLLTAWQERAATDGCSAVWRFSLEDIRTRRRKGFGTLDELTDFLLQELQEAAEQADTQE